VRRRTKAIYVSLIAVATLSAIALLGIQVERSTDPRPTNVEQDQSSTQVSDPRALGSTFFGMHLIDKKNWPAFTVGALGKGTLINWPYVEPQRDHYDWSNLDAWVAQAENHDVEMFYSNSYSPQWAVSDTSTCQPRYGYQTCSAPPNLADWEDFVRDLASRYKGRIDYYELWNEPHATYGFSGTVAQMVTLTNREAAIIREVDPQAKIISPSGSAPYMDQYWAAGGTKDVDIVSIHAYPDPNHAEGPLPEGFTGDSYLLGPMLDVWQKYELDDKPRWDTEGSWGLAPLSESDRAAFLARWYLLHAAYGFRRVYWYAYDNQIYGTLWNPTTGENAGAHAYRTMYRWLLGATVSGLTHYGSSPYKGLYRCDMKLANGSPAVVVWHPDRTAAYRVPRQFGHYRDLDTNTLHTISGPTISVGKKPILLTP
jgi:hypothetical protein